MPIYSSHLASRAPARSTMPTTKHVRTKATKASVLFIGRVRREVLKNFVAMTRCEFIRR
jgi:hypothetical protein